MDETKRRADIWDGQTKREQKMMIKQFSDLESGIKFQVKFSTNLWSLSILRIDFFVSGLHDLIRISFIYRFWSWIVSATTISICQLDIVKPFEKVFLRKNEQWPQFAWTFLQKD